VFPNRVVKIAPRSLPYARRHKGKCIQRTNDSFSPNQLITEWLWQILGIGIMGQCATRCTL
jgi:hypothetical protein